MKKILFAACALFLCAATLAGCAALRPGTATPAPSATGEEDSDVTTRTPAKSGATLFRNPVFPSETPFPTPYRTPASESDATYRADGRRISAGPLEVVVDYVRTVPRTLSLDADPGYGFLLAGLTLRNVSGGKLEVYADMPVAYNLFQVTDPDGNRYDILFGTTEPLGDLERINVLEPGESISGELLFEVPLDLAGYMLDVYHPDDQSQKTDLALDVIWPD
jgi:hypothetical protein